MCRLQMHKVRGAGVKVRREEEKKKRREKVLVFGRLMEPPELGPSAAFSRKEPLSFNPHVHKMPEARSHSHPMLHLASRRWARVCSDAHEGTRGWCAMTVPCCIFDVRQHQKLEAARSKAVKL